MIFKNQFGFRKGHSTSHAITALTEIVRSSLDKTEFSAAVFLDFQKAFDTVDHNILLQKLCHYGVRGVALKVFESYLKNRSQCVVINDAQSNYHEVKHGVPQGSVLGPLMFIIYINDLHNSVCYSTSIHFADDTSLVFTEESLKELNRKVNRDLALLVHWLRANKISLNASKTEIILFRTIRTKITKHLNFRLSGQQIKPSHHAKYLGVFIDENLSWDTHLLKLSQKLASTVGILSKLRHYVDYKTLLSVYYSLFESHVNYCLPFLGFTTRERLNRIEKLQNKALRIIHFKNQRESVLPLYINSRILPITKQRSLKNCLFAFDFFNKKLPAYFDNFLRKLGEVHNTRNYQLDITITNSVTYGSYNIPNLVTKDWNSLHSKLDIDLSSASKSTLKNHLRSFILTSMAENSS